MWKGARMIGETCDEGDPAGVSRMVSKWRHLPRILFRKRPQLTFCNYRCFRKPSKHMISMHASPLPSVHHASRRIFAQHESDLCWVLFVDSRAHTCCSSGVLAPLHICSTRCADFAYSSLSLTHECQWEDVRPVPWRLFQEQEGSNVLLLQFVHSLGSLFNQTFRSSFRHHLPRELVPFSLMQRSHFCM